MGRLGRRLLHGWNVGEYRRVLRGSQIALMILLTAAILWPAAIPAVVFLVGLALTFLQYVISFRLGAKSQDQLEERQALLEDSRRSREQTEELFSMADILQSAEDHYDAGAVLEVASRRLLPRYSGALYVFNNSRDRLDLAKSWSIDQDSFQPAETLAPSNCWALKRGQPHLNDPVAGTLCCLHHTGQRRTLEVPMVARGSVHGLLMLSTALESRVEKTDHAQRVARALADSTSLALSNIALREKLRTQSLRDPLTGLYNRRYMEDALDRYLNMAERTGHSTSVVMIDLDNFKSLNDKHGHAKGDAVLREVAGQLTGSLMPSDVVSRYGGEEILIILPSCSLENALLKAETLRARVESLSEVHGERISASFGIANVPETAIGAADVVAQADGALYAAKQAGKNRIMAAARREEPVDSRQPRLAVG